MNAIEHLESARWTKPEHYAGFNPGRDYVLLTQHRDSDALTRSNWRMAVRDLKAEEFDWNRGYDGPDNFPQRPAVYTWRASHWAVGWVEYLMVREDAPGDVLTAAGEILCSLESYPVLSDDDFSELETEEAEEHWARMSVRDRVDILQRARACIFGARRDWIPHDDTGRIYELLRD